MEQKQYVKALVENLMFAFQSFGLTGLSFESDLSTR
jgi:hypothetical protein